MGKFSNSHYLKITGYSRIHLQPTGYCFLSLVDMLPLLEIVAMSASASKAFSTVFILLQIVGRSVVYFSSLLA